MPELIVDGKRISADGPAYVVAEIGHNHQGDVEKAKALIHAAKECGVDAVKLQKRDNRRLYTRELYDSPYDNEHSFGATYGEHREALELGAAEWFELREFSREEGVTLFATVFDEPSADFLAELDAPAFKIASADLVNTPLLRHVAALGKPIFLSTGGGTMEDVERAVEAIVPLNGQLCLLQCTASYPGEVEELNLGVIETYRERYPELVIGLSDHQSGIAMTLVAYMLGARVIEKHFTLDHAWKGSDHAFSLMPEGMRRLVRDLHRVPAAHRRRDEAPARRASGGRSRRWGRSSSRPGISPPGTCSPPATSSRSHRRTAGFRPTSSTSSSAGSSCARSPSEQDVTFLDVEQAEEPVADAQRARSVSDQLFDLSGRVAVVTGGVGQLGTVYVAGLAERGMKVAVFDVATGELPEGVALHEVDVTDRAAIEDARALSRPSGECRTCSSTTPASTRHPTRRRRRSARSRAIRRSRSRR